MRAQRIGVGFVLAGLAAVAACVGENQAATAAGPVVKGRRPERRVHGGRELVEAGARPRLGLDVG
jgi:hypothetical protein